MTRASPAGRDDDALLAIDCIAHRAATRAEAGAELTQLLAVLCFVGEQATFHVPGEHQSAGRGGQHAAEGRQLVAALNLEFAGVEPRRGVLRMPLVVDSETVWSTALPALKPCAHRHIRDGWATCNSFSSFMTTHLHLNLKTAVDRLLALVGYYEY